MQYVLNRVYVLLYVILLLGEVMSLYKLKVSINLEKTAKSPKEL